MILGLKKISVKVFYKECLIRGYDWTDVRFYAEKYNLRVSERAYANFSIKNYRLYKTQVGKP